MIRFLGRRLFEALTVLVLMSFAIYSLIGLMPGDPIDLMINADPKLTPDDAARLKALYGLDRPIVDRYLNWLLDALIGNFGYSRVYTKPVMEVLIPRLGNTVILLGVSLVISLSIAIPIGAYTALKPYSRIDYSVNLFCFAGISLPPFWLALLLILCFAVVLDWLPAGGMLTVGDGSALDRLKYMILPVLTLTIHSVGGFTRFMRASMLQTLRQDYVRTARAKGLSETRVVTAHALQNALIPLAAFRKYGPTIGIIPATPSPVKPTYPKASSGVMSSYPSSPLAAFAKASASCIAYLYDCNSPVIGAVSLKSV